MTIKLKNDDEIEIMKEAGKIAAIIRDKLAELVEPGITTRYLDKKAEKFMKSYGVKASFKGYKGFPAHITVSIDEEVVHGIPKRRKIKHGEIVSIDLAVIYKGYHGDTAVTVPVGKIPDEWKQLLKITKESLFRGIEQARPGNHLRDISRAIETYVTSNGFSVVRELVGHGIGRSMHEPPQVPNYISREYNVPLKTGMTLAIEPMINLGGPDVEWLSDKWTVVTVDRKPSAHFEHTVAITKKGPLILTTY
ncbi:MAG TPA: type I methionyl aminopeptidase [Candidatus Eremiobacteraeota bacterium]|nr:MAG: Methionine aminopeptidase 1 [bacterium ADurb.Bin363]HPZ08176.1 type I methionyl aminopeptidase [Candidatus Eremiobacteraeota bacterium]